MSRALYRKYRSRTLSDIIGQEHITTSLENALKSGHISHAYLFTGPRGVGKTSVARILAHKVNNLPYDQESTHLDIIEIDAASNRGIDEIRALRERAYNAPANAKYKVYIIDEVHMLTKEAFNALLKILEEPPEFVIFILATTEANKLPETIISRTQRFNFKPARSSDLVNNLQLIAESEKIKISDDALKLIAEHASGSFRDSISLLDQIRNIKSDIGISDVRLSLGIASDEMISEIMSSLTGGAPKDLINTLNKLLSQGYQSPQIARQLVRALRKQLIEGTAKLEHDSALRLMNQLINIPASRDPDLTLEMVLLEPIIERMRITSSTKPAPVETSETAAVKGNPEIDPSARPDIKATDAGRDGASQAGMPADALVEATDSIGRLDEESWQRVLFALKRKHNSLYGIARIAVPHFDNDKLTLSFEFPFHQKRFSDAKNLKILSSTIKEQTGSVIEIVCKVDKTKASESSDQKSDTPEDESQAMPLDLINDIFGGGEILR